MKGPVDALTKALKDTTQRTALISAPSKPKPAKRAKYRQQADDRTRRPARQQRSGRRDTDDLDCLMQSGRILMLAREVRFGCRAGIRVPRRSPDGQSARDRCHGRSGGVRDLVVEDRQDDATRKRQVP